jgi:hypothetical protein
LSTRLVVGFAGRSKSGKTRLSAQVAQETSAGVGSFGNAVRAEARARHLDASDFEVLMELGARLMAEDRERICQVVLSEGGWPDREIVLLDGVRHLSVIKTVKRIIAPAAFRLVVVDTSPESRRKRFQQAHSASSTTLEQIDIHPVSSEVDALSQIADYHADGETANLSVIATIASLISKWLVSVRDTK